MILWPLLPVISIFSLLAAYRNLAVVRYRLEPPQEAPEAGPLVSVVIPARNEEANIESCLGSVLAQTYRPLQVIVVDDNSSDGTAAILARMQAAHPELEVVQGQPLPEGWVGKNHAVHQGVALARGEWLVFLDADTRLTPPAVARLLVLAQRRGLAMLSVMPRHILVGFWERVVQPVILGVVFAGAPPSMIEDPKSSTAAAFGQCILMRRSDYQAIGGHQAVKGEVLENWRLAQRVKAQGLALAMAEGQELVSVRMYTSLAGLWEGWSKNTFHGTEKKLHLLAVVLIFTFVMGLWPALLLLLALGRAALGQPFLVEGLAGLFQLGLTLYYGGRLNQRMDMPAHYAVGYPLGAAIFLGILLNSAYRILTGRGVTWKGRRYA
jgi:chlorobactene glucosyltransferase